MQWKPTEADESAAVRASFVLEQGGATLALLWSHTAERADGTRRWVVQLTERSDADEAAIDYRGTEAQAQAFAEVLLEHYRQRVT